jgi:hypothetical protein
VAVAIGGKRAERLIGFRNNSGSWKMLTAMRRASSHLAVWLPSVRLQPNAVWPARVIYRGLLHDEQVRRVCSAKMRATEDINPRARAHEQGEAHA